MAKQMAEIRIDQTDINAVALAITVTGDRLTGTALENKQAFDAYPEMVADHFNDLCDYVAEQTPEGDAALQFTATEIASICAVLNCREADITM